MTCTGWQGQLILTADGCVCSYKAVDEIKAGKGRNDNPANAQWVPELLITRQRCQDLHENKSKKNIADFNELTCWLRAMNQ